VILSGPDYRDWQVSGVVKPEHRPKPEDVQAVDASMADETPVDDPEVAAPGPSGQTGEAGQVGQLGADAAASGTVLWDPNTNAPATSLTGITQPQTTTPAQGYTDQYGITYPAGHEGPVARGGSSQVTQPQLTQQDLVNYQNDVQHNRPNVSNQGLVDLHNQFNQQQQQNVPNTVANISNTRPASQTPAASSVAAMYNNTPVNASWARDTQGKTDAEKAQLWNFGGSMYRA